MQENEFDTITFNKLNNETIVAKVYNFNQFQIHRNDNSFDIEVFNPKDVCKARYNSSRDCTFISLKNYKDPVKVRGNWVYDFMGIIGGNA